RGVTPGPALKMWDADGKERWTRSCAELLGETKDCELAALAANGSNVVVAAESGGGTVIATIDGKTGATKQTHEFEKGRIDTIALASRANDVAFAGGFSGTANFGTGDVTSTEGSDGDTTTDVLIGRL